MLQQEAKKTVRCLTVLKEFVAECDDEHAEERAILPHGRYVLFLMHLFNMDLLQMNTSVKCFLYCRPWAYAVFKGLCMGL